MILTDRRVRLLFIALAGMEAALFAVYLLLLFRYQGLWRNGSTLEGIQPLTLFLAVWAGLVGMILAIDVLAQSRLKDEVYHTAVVILVLVTGLLGVRLLLYRGAGVFDLRWLLETGDALVNFHRGLQPSAFLLLFALFLWYRASSASSRMLSFFSVGLTFRVGILLMLLGGGLLATRSMDLIPSAVQIVVLYLGLGLLAVALARSDDKAEASRGSPGVILPLDRLAQLLLAIVLVVGLGLVLAQILDPPRLRAMIHLLDPLWALLGQVLLLLLYAFTIVLEWVLRWLFQLIQPYLENLDFAAAFAEMLSRLTVPEEAQQQNPILADRGLNPAVLTASRVILALIIVAVLVGGTYIFLARRRDRRRMDMAEEATAEELSFGGSALQRGLARLRNLVGLVRRYGLGRELLAALSVENIYANLSRLARERGHPRSPAQPPDAYLPELLLAFPGQDAALARITEAYMRVHYGDLPVQGEELEELRRLYEEVRRAEVREEQL